MNIVPVRRNIYKKKKKKKNSNKTVIRNSITRNSPLCTRRQNVSTFSSARLTQREFSNEKFLFVRFDENAFFTRTARRPAGESNERENPICSPRSVWIRTDRVGENASCAGPARPFKHA